MSGPLLFFLMVELLLLLLPLLLLVLLDVVGFMVVVAVVEADEGALDVLALAGVALVDEGEDMARCLVLMW